MQYLFPATLATERTLIRPVTEDDLPALAAVYGAAEVTRYLPMHWETAEDGRQWYGRICKRHAEQSAMQCVIVERASGQVIGVCLLFNFDLASGVAEVGYALAASHWRRGYAQEAVGRLLHYAFEDLGARRIEAVVDPRNAASAGLLERFGFRWEGVLRERYARRGELIDAAMFGLLRREWDAGDALR